MARLPIGRLVRVWLPSLVSPGPSTANFAPTTDARGKLTRKPRKLEKHSFSWNVLQYLLHEIMQKVGDYRIVVDSVFNYRTLNYNWLVHVPIVHVTRLLFSAPRWKKIGSCRDPASKLL